MDKDTNWIISNSNIVKQRIVKSFYCIYLSLFSLSLSMGAANENMDDAIFLIEISIVSAVLSVKLGVLIWKQERILDLMDRICSFTIQSDDDFTFVDGTLSRFLKLEIAYFFAAVVTTLEVGASPFFRSEKSPFLKVGFPSNWRHSDIALRAANFFVFTGISVMTVALICSIIIWNMLIYCSLRYRVMVSDVARMGRVMSKHKVEKVVEKQKDSIFLSELVELMYAELQLRGLVNEMESFFSNIFFLQIATSGICTCLSIYCLAFDISNNMVERMIHIFALCFNIFEIFMVTHFGNEVKLASDRLSCGLFESNWIEQPQFTKRYIIIFGEYLKQPKVLLIGKLYPLTLETFTKILNSVYSMFNVLTNFKQKEVTQQRQLSTCHITLFATMPSIEWHMFLLT